MSSSCEIENKPKGWSAMLKSRYFWKPFLGVVIGGFAGFLYYYFVGCVSGSCAITSNPYMSILYGGLLGWLVVSSPCSRRKC